MSPVVVYQANQYDQDGNVLAATTTVVPSQHPSPLCSTSQMRCS